MIAWPFAPLGQLSAAGFALVPGVNATAACVLPAMLRGPKSISSERPFVTLALRVNDHLLEFGHASGIVGVPRPGNDERPPPFFPILLDRRPGRFGRCGFLPDEGGLSFIGNASGRLTSRRADQRDQDKENLRCSACGERIH